MVCIHFNSRVVLSIKTSRNANELWDSISLVNWIWLWVNWIWLWTLFRFWRKISMEDESGKVAKQSSTKWQKKFG